MPNSMPNDDVLVRSIGRLPVIRAQLASRTWPFLADLSQGDRDAALDGMAIRQYRAECTATLVVRT
jgi:hypothetical protein